MMPPAESVCWACGVTTRFLVHTRPGCSVCRSCITEATLQARGPEGIRCPACLRVIGRWRKLFRRNRSVWTTLRKGDEIVCHGCLALMKEIVSEKRDDEYA